MPIYNLLFIEKDKIYYDLVTNYESNKSFKHFHAKDGTDAETQIEQNNINIIVVNNDYESDTENGETLAEKLLKLTKIKEEEDLPFLIAYTSHVIAKNRWLGKFADAVFLSDAIDNDSLYSQINALTRRKEGLDHKSKDSGLITRSTGSGKPEYFFNKKSFLVTPLDKNTDIFLKYLIKKKGSNVSPYDIHEEFPRFSTESKCQNAASTIKGQLKTKIKDKFGDEIAKIFAESVLMTAGSEYIYNNKFTKVDLNNEYNAAKALSSSKNTKN